VRFLYSKEALRPKKKNTFGNQKQLKNNEKNLKMMNTNLMMSLPV